MTDNRLVKKKESSVEFFIYAQDSNMVPSKAMNVFYNEKMILNRDLTNLAIHAYKKLYNAKNFDFIDSMAAIAYFQILAFQMIFIQSILYLLIPLEPLTGSLIWLLKLLERSMVYCV
ncbi:MAG: hypothetical protein P8Y23_18305 [Candidatus Lokiarchaeota archaeon]